MLPLRVFSSLRWFLPITAAALCCCTVASAQMHRVETPENVTRALGVYEWTGDLAKPSASRLVPVSLFISGHIEDASTYLARPVPLALDVGNVYTVEHAGKPEGTLDIRLARQIGSRIADEDDPSGKWYGYGPFRPPTVAKAKAAPAAKITAQVEASNDDERPHFVAPRPSSEAGSNAGAKPSHTPAAPDENDPERPTLARREDVSGDAADTGRKRKKEKPAGYVTSAGGGLNADPDRPTLRRGVAKTSESPQLEGLPAGMHQAVAVSDPVSTEDHVFARAWDSAEERAAVLRSFQTVAMKRVRSYMAENHLVPGSAPASVPMEHTAAGSGEPASPPRLRRTPHGVSTSTQPAPATTKPAFKAGANSPATLTLSDEQLSGYELSYGGLPTFVYTAQVHAHPAQVHTAESTVYVTLVGQHLPSGEMQLALASVTDAGHLNREPWMRFVDVVDADGSHRASLLFELRAAHTRQFALYRLISATAEQTFLSASM